MLAQIFALDSKSAVRQRLLSMTLSGCISDTQLYIEEQWNHQTGTLGTLPPFVQDRIHALETAKQYDSAEYEALDEVLTTVFTCRTAPLPDCYVKSAQGMNKDIYVGMQGASEFTMSGVLADFNVTGRLQKELGDLPILLTSGKYDTVRPRVVQVMHDNLPLSERVLFQRSGHVTAIDEAGPMNEAVDDFLRRVEQASHTDKLFVPKRAMSPAAATRQWTEIATAFLAGIVIALIISQLQSRVRRHSQGYTSIP